LLNELFASEFWAVYDDERDMVSRIGRRMAFALRFSSRDGAR
jgi:hypothetical protein